jgi:hypothetical protein
VVVASRGLMMVVVDEEDTEVVVAEVAGMTDTAEP